MSFRRKFNTHDLWCALVRENEALLCELPTGALANMAVFRDYVTRGVHRDVALSPSVFQVSAKARRDLHTFMHKKAYFDMEVGNFDHFNEAFRRDHEHNG
jgi:hypothetical protein